MVHFVTVQTSTGFFMIHKERAIVASINREAAHVLLEAHMLPLPEDGAPDPKDKFNNVIHFSPEAATRRLPYHRLPLRLGKPAPKKHHTPSLIITPRTSTAHWLPFGARYRRLPLQVDRPPGQGRLFELLVCHREGSLNCLYG